VTTRTVAVIGMVYLATFTALLWASHLESFHAWMLAPYHHSDARP
jgi:hypothetical protein